MGQRSSVRGPPFDARRAWLPFIVAALALALLAIMATGTLAEEEAWATLDMADVPVGTPLDLTGDDVTFRVFAHWGGPIDDGPVLLVIEPLPEGWGYHVEDGIPTESGFLVHEEGLLELTIRVDEGTSPGTRYVEPHLDHPNEARTLASIPVYLNVPTFFMVPVLDTSPDTYVLPGDRLKWTVAVEAGVPVDRLATLEVVFAPQGWDVHTPWRSALLRDGFSEPVSFTMTVSDIALPGEYAIMFGVRSDDPRVVDFLAVETLMVQRVVSFTTDNGDVHLVAPVGQESLGTVTVVNSGNVPMTVMGVTPVSFEQLPSGWDLVTEGLPMLMPPSSSATFDVGVGLPPEATRAPAGGHDIPLRLMTDRGAVDLGMGLTVYVPEDRTMDVEVLGTWHPTGEAPSEMALDLLVRDLGNLKLDRAVWLTFEGGPSVSYIKLSQPALPMHSGTVAPLRLTIRLDPRAPPGDHWVHLSVRDGSGLLTEVGMPIYVPEPQLSLVGDLEVKAVQDDGHYATGDVGAYVVTGHVVNEGGKPLDFAKVDVYDTSSTDPVHLGYVPIENLPAGGTRTFRFTLDGAEPGDNGVLAHVSVPGTQGNPMKDSLESRFEAEATVAAPNGQPIFFAFAVAIGSMAGLIAILATEAGRFALMAFILIPLYTRLKPEQVTDHFIRGQILGYIKANPGETYTHIKKALKLTNGTFVYHARILESQGHLRSIKDGANRRFYPAEMRIPTEVKDVQLNQVQRMIYTIVMEYPGISQTKIAKLVKLAPSTVNYHVNIMTKVGVIERKRSGRLSLCFATEDTE
jgi:predicted transcriptional regulator